MREIKFRVWDGNKMHLPEDEKDKWDSNYMLLIDGGLCIDAGEMPLIVAHIPMQFTGLLDKNGVEIYEGDVIQTVANDGVRLSKFEVVWDNGSCRFKKRREDNNHFDMDVISEGLKEVIGNIYEYPELI